MNSKQERMISAAKKGGVFQGLSNQVLLIIKLISDRRVNPLLKLLPIGSLVYLVVPDLMVGPIDDAAIIWLGTYLFVELCPPDVVKEHKDALNRAVKGEIPDPFQDKDADIVDAEYWEEGKNS